MTTITYTIPAISCLHCLRTIKNEIGALPGVQAVEGHLASKQITITFERRPRRSRSRRRWRQ